MIFRRLGPGWRRCHPAPGWPLRASGPGLAAPGGGLGAARLEGPGRQPGRAHAEGDRAHQEIAAQLFLSNHTVKTHISRIFAKTGSRDRAAAIGYAHRHNIG
jgi:hypothetical protein